jgi:hypothetical protein
MNLRHLQLLQISDGEILGLDSPAAAPGFGIFCTHDFIAAEEDRFREDSGVCSSPNLCFTSVDRVATYVQQQRTTNKSIRIMNQLKIPL